MAYVLGGGYVCDAGHQLRVTCRCIRQDLELGDPPVQFDDLLRHPIVEALQHKRADETIGAKLVGPAAGDLSLHHLGIGDDHRGATWWEAESEVVWLCAYGFHRSHTPDDAFQYFEELIAADRIYPTEEDYEWLERDLAEGFAVRVKPDAQQLLSDARRHPGQEVGGRVGGTPIGVYVEVVETLEETFVIFNLRNSADPNIHALILAGFYPTKVWDDWQYVQALPHRAYEAGEFAYATLHE